MIILDKSIFTSRELEMLDKVIIELDRDRTLMLTGSLALAIQGVRKQREADDIDICSYFPDAGDLTALGFRQMRGDSPDYEDYFCEFEKDGEMVHFLYCEFEKEDACIEVKGDNRTFYVLNKKYILEYKLRHSFDILGHPQKHKEDLLYILANN